MLLILIFRASPRAPVPVYNVSNRWVQPTFFVGVTLVHVVYRGCGASASYLNFLGFFSLLSMVGP